MKIAIVGVGNVARRHYIPFLISQLDVVLGYHNRTPIKSEAAAKEFGGEVLSSLKAVAEWQPTAALVLTSETCRHQVGTELIRLGLPRLFFEKPLVAAGGQAAVTEDDFFNAKTMLDLAKRQGCETAMVFNYRFLDQTLAAAKIVSTRNFGEVIHATGLVHFACWSHCIDLIGYFGGAVAEIAALAGHVMRQGGPIEAKDVAAAFRMENGATGTLIGTAGIKWQHPLFELILTFQNGRIHMRDLDGTMEVLDGSDGPGQLHETYSVGRDNSRWNQYGSSFKKSLHAYLDSLRAGKPPPVPGTDGLRELQVEAALRRSISQRRPVLVREEFPY